MRPIVSVVHPSRLRRRSAAVAVLLAGLLVPGRAAGAQQLAPAGEPRPTAGEPVASLDARRAVLVDRASLGREPLAASPIAGVGSSASAAAVEVTLAPSGVNCPSVGDSFKAASIAVGLLGGAVALIAYAAADDGPRAAKWALAGAALYAYPTALLLRARPRCHSTDGMAFMYTPLVAGTAAWLSTRTGGS